jgi:hypothetical protein
MTSSRYQRRTGVSSWVVALVVIWLVVGAIAAGQRHYFQSSSTSCAKTSDTVVTILAGPLNYVGANPKITCHVPQPSK